MGSSGSGNLGDYSSNPGRPRRRCEEVIESELEEVARAPFTHRTGQVAAPGLQVRLRHDGPAGRLVVVITDQPQDVVGLLPTRFNYLLACLGEGYTYLGTVTASVNAAVPEVYVRLQHVAP